ncbi:hypothetical protein ACIPSE_04105 [Streptomyces sp. NPDC090106]|uniref:hypothetical protein n=1 Tax=Streptomyces sp. NPDC090106 TaxID=3365946 RepID=UPI00381D5847
MRSGRPTAVVAGLAGVLALTVVNAPAAQAKDTGITVSNIVVNGGEPIVVGTTKEVEPPFSFSFTLPSGYSTSDPSRYDAYPFLYRGDIGTATDTGENFISPGSYTCYEQSSKKADCEGNLYIDPHPSQEHVDSNADATTWKIGVALRLFKASGGLVAEEYEKRSATVQLKRASKLTANASPEPVTKGKKITVTGKLTRANWSTKKYDGYGGRTVRLQFREKGTSTYKTVKTVTSSSTGAVKSTVTVSVDGYWRWLYNGNTTTGATKSAVDYVDVS